MRLAAPSRSAARRVAPRESLKACFVEATVQGSGESAPRGPAADRAKAWAIRLIRLPDTWAELAKLVLC